MKAQTQIKMQKAYAKNRTQKAPLTQLRLRYISILINEFHERRKTNLLYSMRAFARDLNLQPMHLCRVLKNERGLSPRKAEVISRKLNLIFSERRKFNSLVSAASARSKLARNLAAYGLKNKAYLKQAGAAASAVTM